MDKNKTIKIIRKNVFETNSSSCHSLSIPKISKFLGNDLVLPKTLQVVLKDMDGELDYPVYFHSLEDKVGFIINLILNTNNQMYSYKKRQSFGEGLLDISIADDINYSEMDDKIYDEFEKESNFTFKKIKFNKQALKIIDFIKSVLKKHFGIEKIQISQYFFGSEECDSYLEDYENFENLKLNLFSKKEKEMFKQSKLPYQFVNLEDLCFYANDYDGGLYPFYYSCIIFGCNAHFYDTPFFNEEKNKVNFDYLERFLINENSFVRIASTLSEIPFNDEHFLVEKLGFERKQRFEKDYTLNQVIEKSNTLGNDYFIYAYK